MSKKDLNFYKSLLPEQITVVVQVTEEGLVAEIKELENCYTQADNPAELIEMVNDAVFTYLEIPDNFVKQLGIVYLPQKIADELRRIKMQEFCNELIKGVSVTTTSYKKITFAS
ncbi:MAG: hypothetical protein KAR00_01645 [Candidatus Pacebacteria bacterium]|nr:hypothetical protein [Candidatus Paceibacterota bacterium]